MLISTQAEPFDGERTRRWINGFHARFLAQSASLAEADRALGDGDFAANILGGLDIALPRINALPDPSAAAVLSALGDSFLDEVGGTSGPLFGLLFSRLASATGAWTPLEAQHLRTGLGTGLDAIKRVGSARVGDKTLVDALEPAALSLSTAAAEIRTVHDAFRVAAAAARTGAAATSEMLARRGRGSYVGEHALGVPDPGAATVALWLESALA